MMDGLDSARKGSYFQLRY